MQMLTPSRLFEQYHHEFKNNNNKKTLKNGSQFLSGTVPREKGETEKKEKQKHYLTHGNEKKTEIPSFVGKTGKGPILINNFGHEK